MISGLSIRTVSLLGNSLRGSFAVGFVASGLAIALSTPSALAKEPSLTAIELYDGPNGAAYVQLVDVLINGKGELRSCSSDSVPIDKSAYGKFPKVTIAVGGVLDRGPDGVLRYGPAGGSLTCVVPENMKFEHNATFPAAGLADLADLRGRALAPGSDAAADAQPLKKGVRLVFVTAGNVEMADFLLAQRSSSIPGWKTFLAKYPASSRTDESRHVLAALYVAAGEKSLAAYQKTAGTASPSYPDLKDAEAQAAMAHALISDFPGAIKLAGDVRAGLDALTSKGRSELDAYNTAFTAKTPGYAHLQKAKALADAITSVDPAFAPGQKLQADVATANGRYEGAIHSATTAADGKQWDDAVRFALPYRSFADEDPRESHVIDSAYAAYFDQGKQCELTKDWKACIQAYQKAVNTKDTAEANESLKAAKVQLVTVENETAAKAADDKSKTFELQNDFISAYEVLVNLPPAQQAIVSADVTRLAPAYVTAASQRAKEITKAYPNIAGIGDERAIEGAYVYLQRAYQLTDDPSLKDGFKSRMDNLGDELSSWFLERAKHYLQKPVGSGTELGWAYLKEAESYKAANLEAVRDQIKLAEPAHAMHSKLSIRVQFRDQTSQRQSEGFASQMENAIVTGLDTSGLPVKVLRFGEATAAGVDPDFQLAGDVLEHHIAAPPTIESVDSRYVAGVHEIPSEDWNKANRVYDSASSELRTAQAALQGVEAKGNKKDISDLNRQVTAAQQKVDNARVQLDAIAKSKTEDIMRPYTYKKTTYEVIDRLNIQFRIDDSVGGIKGEPVEVLKQDHKQFVVLSDVKPEDANGIKAQGTTPDTTELQTELENGLREDLIKKVLEKAGGLPHKLYEGAKKREEDGYPDDAGESFLRFLNVTADDSSVERQHTIKYLKDQFNFPTYPGLSQ